jgi:hypothetical protein
MDYIVIIYYLEKIVQKNNANLKMIIIVKYLMIHCFYYVFYRLFSILFFIKLVIDCKYENLFLKNVNTNFIKNNDTHVIF